MIDASGIHVTTITPFKKDYEVDYEGIRSNVAWLSESGVTSIVPLGTVGEFASLSTPERKKVAEVTLDSVKGKKKTIVGVSHTSFQEVLDLCRHARDCGADAALVVPPYYYKDREEGLLEFFELVSARAEIDLVIYDVPGLSKINLTPALLEKLISRAPSIVAVKDATKDLTQLAETIRTVGRKVPVITGAEELALYGLIAGSPGATSGIANFSPDTVVGVCSAVREGRLEEARKLFIERMIPFRHLDVPGIIQGFPVQNVYIKEAMNELGMPAGPVRPPLAALPEAKKEELRRTLAQLRLERPPQGRKG